MKKIMSIALLALTLTLTSCKDYLTIVPSDAMFLEDVQALKQTLASWLYNYTDNSSNKDKAPGPWLSSVYSSKFNAYSDLWDLNNWADKESLTETERRYAARVVLDGGEWSKYYSIVGFLNLILNDIDDASGDNDMRNYVKGEALVHRAFCFFKLLQYYAPMDNAAMGVPVYLGTYDNFSDADLSRKSQSAVYGRILADLAEAEHLLTVTEPRPTYNVMFGHDYIYRIKAQLYLWKACGPAASDDDWANAADAARRAIAQTGDALPWDVTTLASAKFYGTGRGSSYPDGYNATYPEALLYQAVVLGSQKNYGYSLDTWRTLYSDNDMRKYTWFGVKAGKDPEQVVASELDPTKKIGGFVLKMYRPQSYFRLSEQYLILAEACAHTNFAEGCEILRRWQSVRYTAGTERDWFVPSTAQELIEEIHRERRREFIMEGDLLWLDMKRLGSADSGRSVAGFAAPALQPGDFRYNFMIPDSETDTNNDIVRNPGWEDYRVF